MYNAYADLPNVAMYQFAPTRVSRGMEDDLPYNRQMHVYHKLIATYLGLSWVFNIVECPGLQKPITLEFYTGETHPDWAPSLNLDKVYVNAKSAMDRESRRVILNVQETDCTK
ncbi:hypothetical protein OUZ56_011628 [Daphnia magna]|uniref:Uncharacterized protein n=1 Tax=Daphnia magna TaxID=35525 RepID=A0ABQ9Z0W5_9CRUS|nr:hypothetical protein OUZ56_011628 [Daphnia magna]